jgi:hypothetical protein
VVAGLFGVVAVGLLLWAIRRYRRLERASRVAAV